MNPYLIFAIVAAFVALFVLWACCSMAGAIDMHDEYTIDDELAAQYLLYPDRPLEGRACVRVPPVDHREDTAA